MQDAGFRGHRFDPIELVFGLFAIAGPYQMLGFIQNHRAQCQPAEFFFIRIAYLRVIRVCGNLASWSPLLDQVFGGRHIYRDVSIKGGFAQELKPLLVEIGAMEQFSIWGTGIHEERSSGEMPVGCRLWRIQPSG